MTNAFTTGHIVTAAEYDADVSRLGAWASGTKTANVTTTGTTYGTGADLLASTISFTADGVSNYLIRAKAYYWSHTVAGTQMIAALNLDAAQSISIGTATCSTASGFVPFNFEGVLVTPSSGSHTVNIRVWGAAAGTVTVGAGTGTGLGGQTPILVAVAVI